MSKRLSEPWEQGTLLPIEALTWKCTVSLHALAPVALVELEAVEGAAGRLLGYRNYQPDLAEGWEQLIGAECARSLHRFRHHLATFP